MKTKTKHTRLLAAIITCALVFLFCVAMPFTVSAAPEDEITSPGVEVEAPAENENPAKDETPPESIITVPDGATPPYHSTGNIVENVRQNSAEDTGLQFVIFKTDSGKIFYLVIDYDKGSDNVYLLTEVGENDLLNFVEVDANGNPVTPPSGNSGNGQQNPGTQSETPAQNSNIGLIVMIIAVLGIGGAAFYFFKSKKGGKNKPFAKTADFDFEDDEDEYEDEPTVTEEEQDGE